MTYKPVQSPPTRVSAGSYSYAAPWDKPGKVGPVPPVWHDKSLPDALETPQPKPINQELGLERGVTQHMPFSIPYVDGTSVEILRNQGEDTGPTVRQLIAMRRMDGQARALYRLITLPMRSAFRGSTFVPADGGDKEAEFIEALFTTPPYAGGMRVPFSRVMAQMLMATFDGFAPFELVYWVPTFGPLEGKIALKKMAYRPSETVTFLADRNGNFNGLRQRTSFQGHTVDVKIPATNSCYFAVQEEERLFYGVSMFQSAFYHFDKKVRLYYIAHLAAQRAAVGTRIGTMDPSSSRQDKMNFTKALADLGVAQFITLPNPNWKIESLKESGTFDFLSYINHHNSQMSKSVLAAFLDSNQGGGSSDTSLVNFGEQKDDLFLLMLQTIMDDAADVINNYVIPKFVQWNFNSDKYPKFKWGPLTQEQQDAIRDTFGKLAIAASSLAVTPEFMFELEKKMADDIGLEIDYKAIEAKRKEAEAQQELMDKLQALNANMSIDINKANPQGPPPAGAPGAGQGKYANPPQPPAQPKAPQGPGGQATQPGPKSGPIAPVGNNSPRQGGQPPVGLSTDQERIVNFTRQLLDEISLGQD